MIIKMGEFRYYFIWHEFLIFPNAIYNWQYIEFIKMELILNYKYNHLC